MSKHSLKPTGPLGGLPVPQEVRTLHANGSASLAEMREFLGTLHGKSPQEVIGIVSSSLLFQSLGIAIAATAMLLFVFTLGPYLIYGPPKSKQADANTTPAAATPTPAAAPTAAQPAASGEAATSQPDVEAASKVLGIDETKPADPKKNPLDNPSLDKLLDGVD
jgi:pyruvate/2-oxoglutarate dehydrogenase complex dihydrolipoamide acyltransferase (E2) component